MTDPVLATRTERGCHSSGEDVTPTGETTGSLTKLLEDLLQEPYRRVQTGRSAAEWVRECLDSDYYAPHVVARLL